MSAHSTSAYSLSLMLHGAFVAAMLFTAFAFRDDASRKSTEIFELVAGPGDNWAATEAPAIGSPDAVSFQPPAPVTPAKTEPVRAPEPVTAAPPEKSPVVAAPVEAVAAPKAEPKKTPPEKTIAQQMEAAASRRERQQTATFKREEAARLKRERAAAAAAAAKRKAAEAAEEKRMSYAEFSKNNPRKTAANTKSAPSKYDKISTKGITDGVAGGTTDKAGAGGNKLSRAEQDALGTYFAMLKQKVIDAHVMPPGANDRLSAEVSFYIASDGSISQVKITRSSGDTAFDNSVMDAFRTITMGSKPDRRGETVTSIFRKRDFD